MAGANANFPKTSGAEVCASHMAVLTQCEQKYTKEGFSN